MIGPFGWGSVGRRAWSSVPRWGSMRTVAKPGAPGLSPATVRKQVVVRVGAPGVAVRAHRRARDLGEGAEADLEHLAPGLELGQVAVAFAERLEGAREVEAEVDARARRRRGWRRRAGPGSTGGAAPAPGRAAAFPVLAGAAPGKQREDVGLLAEAGLRLGVGEEAAPLVPGEPARGIDDRLRRLR